MSCSSSPVAMAFHCSVPEGLSLATAVTGRVGTLRPRAVTEYNLKRAAAACPGWGIDNDGPVTWSYSHWHGMSRCDTGIRILRTCTTATIPVDDAFGGSEPVPVCQF